MSERELNRLKIIEDVEAQRLSVVQAANLAGVSRRQMTRLIKSYRTKGASGLISKKRGQPSNRKYSDSLRARSCSLVREYYSDFGPTLASEYLEEHHDIIVSRET